MSVVDPSSSDVRGRRGARSAVATGLSKLRSHMMITDIGVGLVTERDSSKVSPDLTPREPLRTLATSPPPVTAATANRHRPTQKHNPGHQRASLGLLVVDRRVISPDFRGRRGSWRLLAKRPVFSIWHKSDVRNRSIASDRCHDARRRWRLSTVCSNRRDGKFVTDSMFKDSMFKDSIWLVRKSAHPSLIQED